MKNFVNTPAFSIQVRRNSAIRLSACTQQFSKNMGNKIGFVHAKLMLDWTLIVGEHIAGQCNPLQVRYTKKSASGCLHLSARNSAAVILTYQKEFILERIQTYFGSRVIEDIRFVVDSKHKTLPSAKKATAPVLSDAQIQNYLVDLPDSPLRDALCDFAKNLPSNKDYAHNT